MNTHAASQTQIIGREVRLFSRPVGEPSLDNFELVRAEVPEPGDGQILVRNTWLSVDPYMRGRMDDAPSYIPPFRPGSPLEGAAVGEVLASRSDAVPVGTTVSHFLGWREYAVLDAAEATVVDTTLAPAQAYLGALGTTGLTAYAALTEIAHLREGDALFVSGAAGAVGSVAGQIARKLGASRVIGSAGGPEKTRRLMDDFGFDVANDPQSVRPVLCHWLRHTIPEPFPLRVFGRPRRVAGPRRQDDREGAGATCPGPLTDAKMPRRLRSERCSRLL